MNIEKMIAAIHDAMASCGLRIANYLDRDNNDEFILVVDEDSLREFATWTGRDVIAASQFLKEASGLWGRNEWLLAFVGLKLGIIDRADARVLARSWAPSWAEDKHVLPGFLLREE